MASNRKSYPGIIDPYGDLYDRQEALNNSMNMQMYQVQGGMDPTIYSDMSYTTTVNVNDVNSYPYEPEYLKAEKIKQQMVEYYQHMDQLKLERDISERMWRGEQILAQSNPSGTSPIYKVWKDAVENYKYTPPLGKEADCLDKEYSKKIRKLFWARKHKLLDKNKKNEQGQVDA